EIVFRYSKGVPRLINIICDFLMLSAFAEETNEISIDMVRDIIGDLDFDCQYWSPATNPAEEARLSDKGPHGPSEGLSEAQEMRNILVDISRRIDSFENQIADLNKKLEEIMVTAGRGHDPAKAGFVRRLFANDGHSKLNL